MIYIWLNIVPIAAATIIGFLIGLGWMKISQRPVTPGIAMTALLAEFWLAAILAGALILAPTQAAPWTMAMGSAFIIWIGFVLPSMAVTLAARGDGLAAIASVCGYWLVAMLAQAALMQALGLVAPPTG